MQGTRLSFQSKEDAIHFAEKQGVLSFWLIVAIGSLTLLGWDYYVWVFSQCFEWAWYWSVSAVNLNLLRRSLPRTTPRTMFTSLTNFALWGPSRSGACVGYPDVIAMWRFEMSFFVRTLILTTVDWISESSNASHVGSGGLKGQPYRGTFMPAAPLLSIHQQSVLNVYMVDI